MPYLLFAQEDSQAATVDDDAQYRLVSVSSGKVLDVDGYSTDDGTRIQQWTDRNTANQQWRIKPAGGGYYELVNRNSGKALGITDNSTAESATAEQQTDSSATSQEWRIDEVGGSGAVTLTSCRSAQVLSVAGGSAATAASHSPRTAPPSCGPRTARPRTARLTRGRAGRGSAVWAPTPW